MEFLKRIARSLDAFPYAPLALFLRLVAAHPFFVSGQTKVEGPTIGGELLGYDLSVVIPTSVRDAAIALFKDEYKLPIVSPELAAYAAAAFENTLPVLLVIGLATRLSAFGLLAMTLVIQFLVYPDAWWTVHAYWTALLLVLILRGPGAISLDYLLFRSAPKA